MGAVKNTNGGTNGKSKGKGSGLVPPWPKGVSGNPKGPPPKALSIARVWRELAEATDEEDEQKRQRLVVLGLEMYKQAKAGNVPAGRLFLDRAYGTALLEELPDDSGDTEEKAFYGWLRQDGKRMAIYVSYLRKIKGNGTHQG